MSKLKVLELFAGIGACSKALENLGIEHEIVDAVEIDKYAIRSFNAIHNTNFEPQDISKWDKDIECDLIMHGSPCQDFSIAGKGKGGDKGSGTRSSLMYETLRIVEKVKPKYVIWENVKNLLSQKHKHNFDAYIKAMDDIGYHSTYKVLNAKNYGIPQNRERVFTVSIRNDIENGFEFPAKQELKLRLKDILETEVDEKYYLSEVQVERMTTTNFNQNKFETRVQGEISRTLCARDYKDPKCVRIIGDQEPNSALIQPVDRDYRKHGKERQVHIEAKDDGVSHALRTNGETMVVEPNNVVPIRTANKQGYDLANDGDGIDLAYPNSTTRRGRVGHGVSKTLATGDSMGVIEYRTKNQRIIDTAEKSGFKNGETVYLDVYNRTPRTDVTSTLNAGMDSHQNNIIGNNFRIRKLTPKECWRLMGFDDFDFEKAQKVNSNSQLYKQAGNSIVVNVLQTILTELLNE